VAIQNADQARLREGAQGLRIAVHAAIRDMELMKRRVDDARACGDAWADCLFGVTIGHARAMTAHENVLATRQVLQRPYSLIRRADQDFDRVYSLSYVRKDPARLSALPSAAYPDGVDAAAQEWLRQLSEDLDAILIELTDVLENVKGC
jgi:hypothetical protein